MSGKGAAARTTFVIHTMGGPIRRVFSTLALAKKWARREWTIVGDNAPHFARHASGKIEFYTAKDEGAVGSCWIKYAGKDERPFASINEQRHCSCCGKVDATRSNFSGPWIARDSEQSYWKRDLEDE